MTLKVLGPGGIPGQNASDLKITEFLNRSTELLSKYEAILDSNLQILTEYSSKGGKEDMPLAMVAVQLKALAKQVREAQDGSRIVTQSLMDGFEKRIASTTAAIEAYSEDGGNKAYNEATAAVKERMRKAREAKAEKRAASEAEKTDELIETSDTIVEQLQDIADSVKPDPAAEDPTSTVVEAITDLGDKLETIAGSEADQALAELKERRKQAREARTEARHADRERRRNRMLQASGLIAKARNLGDKTYEASSDAVATTSSSALKVGLAAMLGPASPLINVLDKFVNIDDLTARTVGRLNPFSSSSKEDDGEDKQLTAIQTLRLNAVDGLYAVKDAVADGFQWMREEALAVGRSRKIETARAELNQTLLLDRLQDLKPDANKEGPLSGIGTALKAGFSTLGTWLSKILAALGIKQALDNIPGIGGGRGAQTPPTTGNGGGAKKGPPTTRGGNKGWSRVGKTIGWAGAALGAYEIGSNIVNTDAEAKNRDTSERAFDYGTGALAGATTGGMIGSVVPGVGTAVGAGVGALIGAASVGWKEYSEDIKSAVSSGAKKAMALIDRGWQATTKAASEFYEASKSWATNAYTAVADKSKEWATTLKDKSKQLLDSASTRIAVGIDSLKTSVSDFFADTIGVFNNMKDKAISWAKQKAGAMLDAIPQPVKEWSQAAATKVSNGAKAVSAGVKEGAAVAGQAARAVGTYAADKGGQAIEYAGQAASQAWESVKGVHKSAVNAWTSGGIKDKLVAASSKAGIDAGLVTKIAHFESKFDTNAAPIAGKKREAMNRVKLFDGRMGISSAHGLGQFTDATWQDSLNKWGAKYGVVGGGDVEGGKIGKLTKAQANAPELRTNEDLQALMLSELTKENVVKGRSLGGTDDDANVYAFHNLGGGDATALLTAMQKNPQMAVKDALLGSNPSDKKRARIDSVIKGNSSLYGDGSLTVTEAYQRMGKHMKSGEAFASDARHAQQQGDIAKKAVPASSDSTAQSSSSPAVPSVVVKSEADTKKGLALAPLPTMPMLTASPQQKADKATSPLFTVQPTAIQMQQQQQASSPQQAMTPKVVETKALLRSPTMMATSNPIVVPTSVAQSGPSSVDKLVPEPKKARAEALVASPTIAPIETRMQSMGNTKASSEAPFAAKMSPVMQELLGTPQPIAIPPAAPGSYDFVMPAHEKQGAKQTVKKGDSVVDGRTRSEQLLGAIVDKGKSLLPPEVASMVSALPGLGQIGTTSDSGTKKALSETTTARSVQAPTTLSDSIGLKPMTAQQLEYASYDPSVTMPAPKIGSIRQLQQQSPDFAVQKPVMEMPRAQGTVNAQPTTKETQRSASSAPQQTVPTGNLLNISNIPMFVNDWGMLNVNSHSIL